MEGQKTAAFLKEMRMPCWGYFKSVEALLHLTGRTSAAISSTARDVHARLAREAIGKHPLEKILHNFQELCKKMIFQA